MKRITLRPIVVFILLACVSSAIAHTQSRGSTEATAFVNGRWFNGREFVAETVYVVEGRLQRRVMTPAGATIDLRGRYVVPPFAEGHNHNAGEDEAANDRYLAAGVLYVKNPNNLPAIRIRSLAQLNQRDTIEVAFANGGITGSGGHPVSVVSRAIARGQWTEAQGEGAFYHAIDSVADLDRKWPAIVAGKPDFIKTYLLYSEQFDKRRADARFVGRRGLDPALLPDITRRAHASGLRVTTHVETSTDFHNAVTAGVDEIAHMPGFRGPDDDSVNPAVAFRITEADAKVAAERGTVVVTTLGGITALPLNAETAPMRAAADALHAGNLRLLASSGVRIAIGSDAYADTSVAEALYIHSLRVFDPATLLRMWTMDTPQTIFPGRPIGRLTDGAEASFVVLADDPVADFTRVRQVEMVVKQGAVLRPRR